MRLRNPDVEKKGLLGPQAFNEPLGRVGDLALGELRPRAVIHHRFVDPIRLHGRGARQLPAAHVPFANMGRAVAGRLEKPWQRGGLGIEPVGEALLAVCLRRTDGVVDAVARRKLPCHGRDSARRTDRAQHVELMEVDPLPSEAVEVGRLEPRSAVAGDITPAHVIGIDEDDVGRLAGRGRGFRSRAERALLVGQKHRGDA